MYSKYCSLVKIESSFIVLAFLIINLFFVSSNSYARVFISKDEALKLAFPDSDTIDKKSFFLKPEQIVAIEKLSKTKVDSKLFLLYIGKKDGQPTGYAAIISILVIYFNHYIWNWFIIKPKC